MAHVRRRLGSVGDSAPPSDSSEGSEICEAAQDWNVDPVSGEAQTNLALRRVNGLFIHADSNNDDSIGSDNSGILGDSEKAQVESFFSGLGTEIFVSSSLANLYENVGKDEWRLIYTGVPVLLHDKGSAKSRNTPRVTFTLTERGSCFALWSDRIDNLSSYKVAGPAFHTMCLSTDHRKIIGFSFDSSQAARELWLCIEKLISDPENIALSTPGRKRKPPKKVKPMQLPPKSQISNPCQFHHITSVTAEDAPRYFSLQAFVAKPQKTQRDH
uniref:Putative misexpression suppressor of ras 3 n=1 Tax=Nyssomyia neivai TaxID=330878 RepID=A0A1L8DCY1_9DIPT